MSAATQDVEHSTRTQRSQYRYLFTAKHHGGDKNAAMWLTTISQDTEFAVFDQADLQQIADSRGWYYGMLLDADGDVQSIGTWDEQIAEFQPGAADGDPWHGYPQWPLDNAGPPNRRKQQSCSERGVFKLMVTANMITKVQCKRLLTGRPA